MFKKGDKVIMHSNSRFGDLFLDKVMIKYKTSNSRYDVLFLDKVVTVKTTKPMANYYTRSDQPIHIWLTFEEIHDGDIGNGLSSRHFQLAVNRKSRIEKLF